MKNYNNNKDNNNFRDLVIDIKIIIMIEEIIIDHIMIIKGIIMMIIMIKIIMIQKIEIIIPIDHFQENLALVIVMIIDPIIITMIIMMENGVKIKNIKRKKLKMRIYPKNNIQKIIKI